MFRKLMLVLSLALAFQTQSGFAENDALDEVNRTRAARGLAPFQRDEALSQAAAGAANHRAATRNAGHTSNDFAFLPPGSRAQAAGCAAWQQGQGWGACCTYENWKYAGAAYAIGPDGRRYMHLFVSNTPNAVAAAVQQQVPVGNNAKVIPPAQVMPPAPVNAPALGDGVTWAKTDSGQVAFKDGKQLGFLGSNGTFYYLQKDGSLDERKPESK